MNRITNPSELLAVRMSYIPSDRRDVCQKIQAKQGECVAWIWTGADNKFRAVVFMGKSQKPYSGRASTGSVYYFKTEEQRRAFIAQAFESAAYRSKSRAETSAEKSAARAAGHPLKVGDVLRSSWGYDQTNVEWWQVTKLIGSTMVEVREIAQRSEGDGYMTGTCVPTLDSFIGQPKRCKVSEYGARDSVRVHRCACAYLEKPREVGGIKCFNPATWSAYA